jgi:phage tail sheath protein FI
MPEYLSPGVYVEEIDAGPKPIEGVSTSTAGAVGVTAFGPTSGKPELVTSLAEFTRKFGDFLPEPDSATVNKWALNPTDGGRWWHFPLAVKGFFDNGGQRLYVKRVFAKSAPESRANLGQGMVGEIVSDAATGAKTLKLRHLIDIAVGTTVQIFRGNSPTQVGGDFHVTAFDQDGGAVTLDAAIPEALLAKRGDFVQIHARSATPVAPANTTLTFRAKSKGAWGNALCVRARPMVGATLNILYDPNIAGNVTATTTTTADTVPVAGPPLKTTVTVNDVTGFTDNDRVLINGKEYVVKNLNAAGKSFDVEPSLAVGQTWSAGTTIKRLRRANTGGAGKTINVWGASALYAASAGAPGALVELSDGTTKETFTVVKVTGNTVEMSGTIARTYYEGHKLRVIEAEVSVRYSPENGTAVQEDYANLRLTNDGSMSYLVSHINTRSALVQVTEGGGMSTSDPARFPIAPSGAWEKLSGGNDQLDQLTTDDFVGVDGGSGNRTGIQALEDIDEISICLAPGMWASTIHSALVQHCETLKDRFAILDPQDGLSIEGIRAFREPLDTKYAALYYPWIEVRDPSVSRNVQIAPSGHTAGIYARVDVERGVHKAPANEVIRGITKIAQDVTKREHDMLNPKNINVLRFFPGRGNRVWGARVVTSDSAWKYINVRRLFIYVEESIDEGTQWVVFEPNDEPLWARVRQTITNFLTSVWRSGALQGAKPDEAFFVKCDHSTMTQDDIDNGRLICLIGIAPVKPAEFVIFRIQQKTLETKAT